MTDNKDYCYYPINNKDLDAMYQTHKRTLWIPSEIPLSEKDRRDWEKLDNNTKTFLTFILGFFAQADGIVTENLMDNFIKETSRIKEAKAFYAVQICMEQIHNETYSLLIDTFISDKNEKMKLFDAIDHYPSIKKLADWSLKWFDPSIPLHERCIAFACVEGIFFAGAFCAIYYIQTKHILEGLCKANEWIARDEALHTDFGIKLYNHLLSSRDNAFPDTNSKGVYIIKDAMNVAEEFIRDALKVELIGLNAEMMIQYVKCTADYIARETGHGNIYNSVNPFNWMTLICLSNKTNFFEGTVSEYAKKNNSSIDFTLNEDF